MLNRSWVTVSVLLIIAIFFIPSNDAQTIVETYVVPPLNFTNILSYVNYTGFVPAANTSRNITSSVPDGSFDLQYYRFQINDYARMINISMYNVISNTNESCASLRIYVSGTGFPCSSLKYSFTDGYVCTLNTVQWAALKGINTTFSIHAGFHRTIWRPGGYLYIGIGREVAATAATNCAFSLYITQEICGVFRLASSNVFDFTCLDRLELNANTTFTRTTQQMSTLLQLTSPIPANVVTAQLQFNVTSAVSEFVNAYGRSYSVGDYLMHDCGTNSSAFVVSGTNARSFFSCYAPPPGPFYLNLVRKYASDDYSVQVVYSSVVCPNGTLGKNCEFSYTTIQWPSNGTIEYQITLLPSTLTTESWVYWRFDEPASNQLQIEFTAAQTNKTNTDKLPYMYLRRGTFPYSGRGGIFGGFEWTPRQVGSQNASYVLMSQDLIVGGSYFLGIMNPSNTTTASITLTGVRRVPTVSYSSTTGIPDLNSDSSEGGRLCVAIWSIVMVVLSSMYM